MFSIKLVDKLKILGKSRWLIHAYQISSVM